MGQGEPGAGPGLEMLLGFRHFIELIRLFVKVFINLIMRFL